MSNKAQGNLCPNPTCEKPLEGERQIGTIIVCNYCSEVAKYDYQFKAQTLQLVDYMAMSLEQQEIIDKQQQAIVWKLDYE